jgi:hypothetical protein
MTVFAVTGQHTVVFADGGNGANRDRFLADVQVTEATDLPRLYASLTSSKRRRASGDAG